MIGEGFCPFAASLAADDILVTVSEARTLESALQDFGVMLESMHGSGDEPAAETALLVFDRGFRLFDPYLDLLDAAQQLLAMLELEGVFQLASFHPRYCFDGLDEDDAANFTNRSPFPILHLLREESVAGALSGFAAPESIPERNIDHARALGSPWFRAQLAAISEGR